MIGFPFKFFAKVVVWEIPIKFEIGRFLDVYRTNLVFGYLEDPIVLVRIVCLRIIRVRIVRVRIVRIRIVWLTIVCMRIFLKFAVIRLWVVIRRITRFGFDFVRLWVERGYDWVDSY